MPVLSKLARIITILVASFSANAADQSVSGNGSVMLSIWQEGSIEGGGFMISAIIDTGLHFSDLINLNTGETITVYVENIFDVSGFLDENVISATKSPRMNIVAGTQVAGHAQMFSSCENDVDSAINVELNNALNKSDRFLAVIPDTGYVISLDYMDYPNAGNTDEFGDNFGKAFGAIDNAIELIGASATSNNGSAKGKMLLFQTSAQGTLNGQPVQINNFASLFTFNYDLVSGELKFSNSGIVAK